MKYTKSFLLLLIFFLCTRIYCQNVAITDSVGYNAHASSMLDVYSFSKGLLIPRTDTLNVSNPAKGLLICDTSNSNVIFYFYNGTNWVDIATSGGGLDTIWNENLTDSVIFMRNAFNKLGIGIDTPYAKAEIMGDTIHNKNDDEPIFIVRDKDGNEVFVVYPKAVYVYVDEAGGSTKELSNDQPTGFRVGKKTVGSTKDFDEEYFSVSPASDADTIDPSEARVLWYPKKEAFMAGRVLVEGIDSVGTNSWASGFESKSIGDYSQALGYQSRALGHYSTAMGYKAQAEGDYSVALGDSSVSGSGGGAKGTADNCYAFGRRSQASGNNSYAFGNESEAIGNGSYAFGESSVSKENFAVSFGKNAFAEGINSFALGESSHAANDESYALGRGALAEGIRSFAFGSNGIDSLGQTTGVAYALGDYSFAIGQGSISEGFGSFSFGIADTARGSYSLAGGYTNTSEGYASTAFGYHTRAAGNFATSLGYYSTAEGPASSAIGGWCTAYSDFSLAAGYDCQTTGPGAIALGFGDSAAGHYSFAAGHGSVATNTASMSLGYYNHASGVAATALGYNTTAQSSYSLVIGTFNTIAGDSTWGSPDSDPVFVIGNGIDENNRSNALTVLRTGYTGIGIATPDQMLDVNGHVRLRGNIYDYYNNPGSSGNVLMRTSSGVMWSSSPPTHTHGTSDITSGTFDAARIPSLDASKITSGSFDAARIPNLDAGKITTGSLSVARGGTGQGTLTAGKVVVGNGTSGVLVPDGLHWDNSNGRLGIGTSSPGQTLEVNGNMKFSTGAFNIYNGYNRKVVEQGWSGSWYDFTAINGPYNWADVKSPNSLITSLVYPLLVMIGNNGTPYNTTLMSVDNTGIVKMPYVYSNQLTDTPRDVFIASDGTLGYSSSSLRYKKDIKDMENIDWLYKLRPVNYVYKTDTNGTKQYGLIAEEVEKINTSFVSYNKDSIVETVQYSQLITPMLKAIQSQKKTIDQLKLENHNQGIFIEKQNESIRKINEEMQALKKELLNLKEEIKKEPLKK